MYVMRSTVRFTSAAHVSSTPAFGSIQIREPTVSCNWRSCQISVIHFWINSTYHRVYGKDCLHLICPFNYKIGFQPSEPLDNSCDISNIISLSLFEKSIQKPKQFAGSLSPLPDRNFPAFIKYTTYTQIPGNMCWSVHTSELIRHHWSKQTVQSFTAPDMSEQAMLLLSSSQHNITKTTFYGDHNLHFQMEISVFRRPKTAFQTLQHLIFQFQNSLHHFLLCLL